MARGRPARRPARGGEGIQALRRAGARLTLALASALAFAGALAWAIARAGGLGGLVAAIGAVGAPLLGLVLWRGAVEVLPWALAAPGAAYAVALAAHGGRVDAAAPLVAVGLLLCGELAAWSADERRPTAAEAAVVRRRAVALGALALAGLVASALAVALAAAPAGRGLAWTTAGAAAAVGAVAIAVALARRGPT